MADSTSDSNPPSEVSGTASPSDSGNGHGFQFSQLWQQISSLGDKDKAGAQQNPEPVTILGHEYTDKEGYESEIRSKIWLTYRFGFEPIPKAESGPHPLSFVQSYIFNKNLFLNGLNQFPNLIDNEKFTSDVGWGCMIRTSQSLLANSFLHLLGSDASEEAKQGIVDLFQDNTASPFSLHNFIHVASDSPLKVKPGEWFGPNAASLSIKRLCDKLYSNEDIPKLANEEKKEEDPSEKVRSFPRLRVLISESSDLYDSQISEVFSSVEPVDGLLVLLPVRLGIDRVNEYYYSSLKQLLSLKQSVGIAGGKPSSSFYFVGYEGKNIIYLNPHNPQPYQDSIDYSTYHTLNYQKLDIGNLDPSMMIGILLKNIEDYNDFKTSCQQKNHKIVHFHSSVRRLPKQEATRKNSEFITIDHSDLKGLEVEHEGEFVNLDGANDSRIDDFVDLGDEPSYEEEDFDSSKEHKIAVESDLTNVSEEPEVVKLPKKETENLDETITIASPEPFETITQTDIEKENNTTE